MTLTDQHQSRHSGDINLVAALMALGIPLDPVQPAALVEKHDGENYASFYLLEYSEDGSESAERLCEYWMGSAPIPPGHGFKAICEFIRARPRGVQKSTDLLDFAVDWLRERGFPLPGLRNLDDVPRYVGALPESDASHVLAYVWNRHICYELFKQCSRQIYYESGEGAETRRALIDSRLPRWQAKELLARLEG